MVIISVEKVPKKLMETWRDLPENGGRVPLGVTLAPKMNGGFRKIEVYVQEKMSQYKTRLVLAHELMHCLQHLTGCQMDEKNNDEIDVVMVAALKDKPKGRKKT